MQKENMYEIPQNIYHTGDEEKLYKPLGTDLSHKPSEEIAFYKAIAEGNIPLVKKICTTQRYPNIESYYTLSDDPLLQKKKCFLIMLAIASRFCIEYGMSIDASIWKSTHYMKRIDSILTEAQLIKLYDETFLDYTQHMSIIHNAATKSKLVNRCIQYVHTHPWKHTTVTDISDYLSVTPNHLSRAFKKEMGIPLSDYIRDFKIKMAKDLIIYEDKSFAEISELLGFSSLSHFISVFKANVGSTPKEYRTEYNKSFFKLIKVPLPQTDAQ